MIGMAKEIDTIDRRMEMHSNAAILKDIENISKELQNLGIRSINEKLHNIWIFE